MEMTDANTGQGGKKRGRKKPPLDLSTMVYGKVPPQARELEEAVLGAIMREPGAFELASEIIKQPEVFYVDANQKVFKAMKALALAGQKIDELTVVEQLRKQEELEIVGGPYYVLQLTNKVVSAAHIETHSKLVFERFIKRELIRTGGEMITEAYEDSTDAFEILDASEQKVLSISNAMQRRDTFTMDSLAVKFAQETAAKVKARETDAEFITGVTTGFKTLDKITNGWQKTDLIILAARPSVGKTAFALNLARNAALCENVKKRVPVAVFNLEMSAGQCFQRLVSAESGVNLEKIAAGRLSEEDQQTIYKKGIQVLADSKLFIDDTPGLNIFELRAKCRRLKNQHNIGLIIIDYLQLMNGSGEGNREQEISTISRNLKRIAKELEVPVIALSQLSREVEKRKDFKPQLSDLRESGAIEQDADFVGFIYRPEYHDIHKTVSGESTTGLTSLKIAKHRNGALDTVDFRAQLWIQKFIEKDSEPNIPSPLNKGQGIAPGNLYKVIPGLENNKGYEALENFEGF